MTTTGKKEKKTKRVPRLSPAERGFLVAALRKATDDTMAEVVMAKLAKAGIVSGELLD